MNNDAFHARLRALGFRNALEFARRTGIHRNTISLYLQGREILQGAFVKIAGALKCDPLDLVQKKIDAEGEIEHLSEIRQIIDALVKADAGIAVLLLGSRAKGTARPYADWDIGITRNGKPIDGRLFLTLRGKTEELAEDLPRSVDLVNLDAAPAWFLEGIDYEPLFLDGNREGAAHFLGVIHGIRKRTAA
jgi:predicted nucleotidyltransferase